MTEESHLSAALAPPVLSESDNGDSKKPAIKKEEIKKIKKRGPFNIFKSALFLMRRSSKDKKKKVPITQKTENEETIDHPSKRGGENWKKLVGSIRPLHVPDNPSPSISPSTTYDNFDDLIQEGSSVDYMIQRGSSINSFYSPSVYGGSSIGSMSQYASASNLQELLDDNNSDDDRDPDEVLDAIQGDELIDAKAEEFIAQFYQQMKLQSI